MWNEYLVQLRIICRNVRVSYHLSCNTEQSQWQQQSVGVRAARSAQLYKVSIMRLALIASCALHPAIENSRRAA